MIPYKDEVKVKVNHNKYSYVAVVLAIIGFVSLTIFVVKYPVNIFDLQFTLRIQEYKSNFLDEFMTAVSLLGRIQLSVPTVLVTAFGFFLLKKKKEAIFIILTMIAGLVSTLVKYFVDRPRPSKDLVRLIEITKQQSFPSGHTIFYTVFFGFIIYLMVKLTSLNFYLRLIVASIAGAMVILVFFSRIYLGAHWLTDVLGGYLLGIICLYVLIYFYELKRFKD